MGSCLAKEQLDFEGPIDFKHFEILRAIGKGAFGKVCIVKKKDTKDMFAMKYMNKVQIIEKRAVDNVFREIHILKALDHPFIVNLWFSFQDEEDIFLVLDLMLGGDISYHLEKEGRFAVPRVRLYMAEICQALDYLAEKKIIHRDLKPANMLLDSKGHIHLTDFNVASIQRPGKEVTSMTGTKPYMAPEVIKASHGGYDTAVDWWSLGVSAYEMLRGERPYNIHHNMSNDEIYRVLTRVRPPASARWEESTCNVLKLLLHPDPTKRLSNLEQAKLHPFFEHIDWEKVYNLETTPSYKPSQNRIHCDPTHELEEMIVEPNPLHKKKSRLSKRKNNEVSIVKNDLDKINERFMNYNRLTDSILHDVSHDELSHLFSVTVPSSPHSSMDVQNDLAAIRDTSLSLRKEIATEQIITHKKNNHLPSDNEIPVTSPVEVIVQLYEEDQIAVESSKGNHDNNKPQEEESQSNDVLLVEQETVTATNENTTNIKKVNDIDIASPDQDIQSPDPDIQSPDPDVQSPDPDVPTPDPEVVSEILSSGTPSNIYNPKDSDSIVPMHLLGSYNGSIDGDPGLLVENSGVDNGLLDSGEITIENVKDVSTVNYTVKDECKNNEGGIDERNSDDSPKSLLDNSDTRILLN